MWDYSGYNEISVRLTKVFICRKSQLLPLFHKFMFKWKQFQMIPICQIFSLYRNQSFGQKMPNGDKLLNFLDVLRFASFCFSCLSSMAGNEEGREGRKGRKGRLGGFHFFQLSMFFKTSLKIGLNSCPFSMFKFLFCNYPLVSGNRGRS